MVDSRANGYLYTIKDIKNSFIYIGITNDVERRKREHFNNSHVKVLKEHNKNNLVFTVECIGTYKYIANIEKELIYSYRNKSNFNVLNIHTGGESPSGITGEDHWNAHLTEDQVILIRELYSSEKYTGRKLSELFNTGYKNISKIVRGERWMSVGGPITTKKLEISKVANRSKIPPEEVPLVREEALNRFIEGKLSIPEFAKELGIARQSLRLLLLGKTWSKLDGPLLKVDYWKDFGRDQ